MNRLTHLSARINTRLRRSLTHRLHKHRLAAMEEGPWQDFRGLSRFSTAFVGVQAQDTSCSRVNLVVPDISIGGIFAGIRTALLASAHAALETGYPLRVLSLGYSLRGADAAIRSVLAPMQRRGLVVEPARLVWQSPTLEWSPNDLVIVTYWSTAHAVDVACRSGIFTPRQVIYLIQDYEPDFYARGTESLLAESTYHAGFVPIVNSAPLCDFLKERVPEVFASAAVFRPDLDQTALSAVRQRRRHGRMTVAFYGRPSKPRNAFHLGIAALRTANRILGANAAPDIDFVSVGESHGTIDLGAGSQLKSLGRLSWTNYYDFLGDVDVMLSLQSTAHPSHPPLDAVAVGAVAVTNEVSSSRSSRSSLSPRLLAVGADPMSLASAIVEGLQLARETPRSYDETFVRSLGPPLSEVMALVARQVAGDV